jgi:hypothetical protein
MKGGIRPETDREKIRKLLAGINWDSTRDVMEYYDVLWGRVPESKWFNRHQVLARLLTHMPWYRLLRIVPFEEMKERLNDEVISFLWPREVREYGKRLQKLLRKDTISDAGWSPETIRRCQATVSSDRRHRFESLLPES